MASPAPRPSSAMPKRDVESKQGEGSQMLLVSKTFTSAPRPSSANPTAKKAKTLVFADKEEDEDKAFEDIIEDALSEAALSESAIKRQGTIIDDTKLKQT